jgi:hypothetical protein
MAQPQLGYGKPTEATIDQVNRWMRAQPWYQQQLKAWGHPAKLSKAQGQQILRKAQAQGVVVDQGDMEVDSGGNFNPKGHKLRNTLIVAGIAGATIATAGAAGAFAAGAAPAAGGLSAGTSGVMAGLPGAMSTLPALKGVAGLTMTTGAGLKGLSYAEMLKHGLPIAGGLVNGVLQRKNDNAASEIERRYLDEALAYQKEQDAYDRNRREGRDAIENGRYSSEWDRNETRYGDTQSQYLSEFERDEDRYGHKVDLEASRYGDFSKRIAPYMASGANANARMASLLGLPATAAYDPSMTAPPTRVRSAPPALSGRAQPGGSQFTAVDLDPDVSAFISDWQSKNPVSAGVGPLYDALAAKGYKVGRPTRGTGALSDDKLTINGHMYDFASNWNPQGTGSAWAMNYHEPDARPYAPAAPRPAAPATTAPAAPPVTAQPQARTGALVTVRAPTGQTSQVPSAQLQHYLDRGATLVPGAA